MTRACFGCVLLVAALGAGCSLAVLDEELLERRFACDIDADCPTDQRCSARSIFDDGPRDEVRLCVPAALLQEECPDGTVLEDPDDPLNFNCGDDADGDRVVEPLDCDDNNASLGSRATDADCDGVPTTSDCDDDDASSTIRATDADCDGVPTAADCADDDPSLAARATDADCDGVLTVDDCDDNNASLKARASDTDCDGVLTAEDCDDNNATSPTRATDADCDGVPTAADCDDNNASSTTRATDADCDGVLDVVGDACSRDIDCGNDLFCERRLAGGYCTADCAASRCPAGSTCFGIKDGSQMCFDDCDSDDDCPRTGYICDFVGGIGTCFPG